MIRHIVMFKLKATEGMSEYDNALEAKKRFDDVIANVKEMKQGQPVLNSKDAAQPNYTNSLTCNFAKFLGTVTTDRACIDYELNA